MFSVVIILAWSYLSDGRFSLERDKTVAVKEMLGSTATIPCLLLESDGRTYTVQEITWYKDSQTQPIYRWNIV